MSETWQAIERQARREAELSRRRIEARGLEWGMPVAWCEYDNVKTNGLSLVHRVADPDEEYPETFCGETVPAPVCRLDLSIWPAMSLRSCKYCAKAYLRALLRRSA